MRHSAHPAPHLSASGHGLLLHVGTSAVFRGELNITIQDDNIVTIAINTRHKLQTAFEHDSMYGYIYIYILFFFLMQYRKNDFYALPKGKNVC